MEQFYYNNNNELANFKLDSYIAGNLTAGSSLDGKNICIMTMK